MRTPHLLTLGLLAICLAACGEDETDRQFVENAEITVFEAKRIITMEPANPAAKFVAVQNGRILGVTKDFDDLSVWLNDKEYSVDDRFDGKILMPGFVDPHLHPMMAAVLLPMVFITPEDWDLPRGYVRGVRSPNDYEERLEDALDVSDRNKPFFTWGYHELWHGPMDREFLDEKVDSNQPIIIWQRSFHEVILNTPALELIGISNKEEFDVAIDRPGVDPRHASYENGHFSETALPAVLERLNRFVMTDAHLARGYNTISDMLLASGVTTIADMATGIFLDFESEAKLIKGAFDTTKKPVRTLLVPMGHALIEEHGSAEQAATYIEGVENLLGSERLLFDRRVKFLADGAFFSQLMRMNPPGYADGHKGKWLTPPDQLEPLIHDFWKSGYAIHCHVNGDEGLDAVLSILERAQLETPRPDHRFTLEHFGYSTEDQNRRVAALGASVSAQPNYLYVLSDKYARHGLGWTRASQMVRLGSLEKKDVPIALHSDLTMAPSAPLFLAWIAANRENMEGDVMASQERISLDKALRAITIDAAYILGLEDEIGSIAPGKKADFAILERDPYRAGADELKDIEVWGVVFEGEVHRAE